MRRSVTTLGLVALLAGLATAQPQPAPEEMKRLDRLVGQWAGSGTAKGEATQEHGIPWTSRTTTTKVMEGHFLREDQIIELEGMPPLAFINLYGYDQAKERFVVYSVSNAGEMTVREMHWIDENTTVLAAGKVYMGKATVERWTTTIGDGVLHYLGEEMGPTGPAFVHVKGTSKRVEDGKPVDVSKVGAFFAQPSPQMKYAARMVGTYVLKGSYAMAPEQEKVEFVGEEVVKTLFGGLVLEVGSSGEDYAGVHWMVWDAREKCFRQVGVNTWGMHNEVRGYWADDHDMVFTFDGDMMGQPMLTRTILTVDDAGKVIKGSSHAIAGNGPPFHSFTGTYELQAADGK